jgi:hypothetical protein
LLIAAPFGDKDAEELRVVAVFSKVP